MGEVFQMSVLLSYGVDKSDQHMIFCSTELQLIPLFCLKQHRRRLFYQQKKHSITLITTVVQATFNFSSSFFFCLFFSSPITFFLLTPYLKHSVTFTNGFFHFLGLYSFIAFPGFCFCIKSFPLCCDLYDYIYL